MVRSFGRIKLLILHYGTIILFEDASGASEFLVHLKDAALAFHIPLLLFSLLFMP